MLATVRGKDIIFTCQSVIGFVYLDCFTTRFPYQCCYIIYAETLEHQRLHQSHVLSATELNVVIVTFGVGADMQRRMGRIVYVLTFG